MKTGRIFNIQRYSTEDGPGIRTSIFMKGCPLKCIWCHNPEGINPKVEVIWHESKCIACGECVRICPNEAIRFSNAGLLNDVKRCQTCGKCVDVCPKKARELVGRDITLEEAIKEAKKDKIFYDKSLGGVTVGGGEPCMQWEFVRDFFQECKAIGIHTALDTSGYIKWDNFFKVLNFSDLVLYDLKLVDEVKHQNYTCVKNRLIIDNIKKVSQLKKSIWIRIPIIPGCTDEIGNLMKLASLIEELKNVERVELLPYHKFAEIKYKGLGLNYQLKGLDLPSDDYMEKCREIIFKNVNSSITVRCQ